MAHEITGYETAEQAVEALKQEFPACADQIDESDVECCDGCDKWFDAEEGMASLGGDRWMTGRDGTEGLVALPAICIPCRDEEQRTRGRRF
jgi:hypothetical protein